MKKTIKKQKMKKFHIHVYKIGDKQEFDVEAKSEQMAKHFALQQAKIGTWDKSDCSLLALTVKE